MRRRHFLGTALATAVSGASQTSAAHGALQPDLPSCAFETLPSTIAGKSLEELRDEYRDRLFHQYLPFWDRGGFDKELGGFICELNDDGSVFCDEKQIWYQGRAVWIYSRLYNDFGREERFLDVARKTRDFMVTHMFAGDGRWQEKVRRDGTVVEGPSKNVYGSFPGDALDRHARGPADQRPQAHLCLLARSEWGQTADWQLLPGLPRSTPTCQPGNHSV